MLAAINFHYIRKDFTTAYASIFGNTPGQFEQQLLQLATTGDFVSANDIEQSILQNKPLPEKSIIITFDDGLKEQFDLALPILEKHRIPAIFFINTSNFTEPVIQTVHKIHLLRSVMPPQEIIEQISHYFNIDFKSAEYISYGVKAKDHYKYDDDESALLKYILNFVLPLPKVAECINVLFGNHYGNAETQMHEQLYMSVEQVKYLQEKNMLGSHAHNHLPVGQLPDREKILQVQKSQEVIYDITGKNASAFSYPYGSMASTEGLSSHLKNASFVFSFTMERAINHNLDEPFYLSRLDNNDAPMGKNYKHAGNNFFSVYSERKWNSLND